MVVIRGRRRIGKSRLIKEFGNEFKHFYSFSGLPPTQNTTAQGEREEFCRQMSREFGGPLTIYEDWGNIFWALGNKTQKGKILILFDEISWMGSKDHTFMPKIKNLWDLSFNNNHQLVFVICGSASSWIEKNILSSTGFFGRISLRITLKELPLHDCNQFWPENVSALDKLTTLSVTGGVPKYLEEINLHQNAETNINRLCFTPGALLVDEFDHIFNKLFITNSHIYSAILKALVDGPQSRKAIIEKINFSSGNRLTYYIKELALAGFVETDQSWSLKTTKSITRNTMYRLCDNYMRFYLKYIEPNLEKINHQPIGSDIFQTLKNWPSIMGLQFENLVASNINLIYKALEIKPETIENLGPYNQPQTNKNKGCQIDYLIQTRHDLYIIEIKFSKNPVGCQVIEEVKTKIERLVKPKHLSIRAVLIHVGGTTDELDDTCFFAKIIDFTRFLA